MFHDHEPARSLMVVPVLGVIPRMVWFGMRMRMIVRIVTVCVRMRMDDDLTRGVAGRTVLRADAAGSTAFRALVCLVLNLFRLH